jgi:hypothetical protein
MFIQYIYFVEITPKYARKNTLKFRRFICVGNPQRKMHKRIYITVCSAFILCPWAIFCAHISAFSTAAGNDLSPYTYFYIFPATSSEMLNKLFSKIVFALRTRFRENIQYLVITSPKYIILSRNLLLLQ